MPRVRAFTPSDVAVCLGIFDSNVPHFFGAHERAGFSSFLLQPARSQDYLVLQHAGQVLACGGLALEDAVTAAFCWGIVHRHWHRKGLGKEMAVARLARAQALGVQRVILSTSQHTQDFYARQGFSVSGVVIDGHGPGLDAVEMAAALIRR